MVSALKKFYCFLDQCLAEVTSDKKGKYNWNYTDKRFTQTVECPYGGGNAVRYCRGNRFKGYANWQGFDSKQCNMPLPPTENNVNTQLQDILKVSTSATSLSGQNFY